jgi:hypothetical protein
MSAVMSDFPDDWQSKDDTLDNGSGISDARDGSPLSSCIPPDLPEPPFPDAHDSGHFSEHAPFWESPDKPKNATIVLPTDQWPEPINPWDSGDASHLATVTEEMMPPAIWPYVADQSDRAGVDINQVALNCYTACAAMIRAGIGLKMQQDMGDGGRVWTEYPILWAAVVGMFSEKKGVGLDLAVDYLKSIDTRQRIAEQADWERYADQAKEHENDLKDYFRDKKKNPGQVRPEEPEKPPRTRLWSDDATLQALGKLFTENPRRKISIIKDELSGWFGSFDAFNNGKSDVDRPAYLSFYESKLKLIDRVGGGFYPVDPWGGCILGGIQPDVLAKIAAKLGGDGMLQRFQVIISKPARQVPRRPADKAATALWIRTQENLFHMEKHPNGVQLSDAAAEFMDEKVLWINRALGAGLAPSLAGALGKWEGLFGRLMITSHCIKTAAESDVNCAVCLPEGQVSLRTAQQCWNWMQGLLWPHAVQFYTKTLDTGTDNRHILAFANYVIARNLDKVRPGYLSAEWSHYKRYMRTTAERKEFFNAIVSCGLALPSGEMDKTLQIAKTYIINPKFLDGRFNAYKAAAEERAERYREIMPDGFTRDR